jgi:Undecaprenyl-phosphate galactose phosphotransferase WbaP
MQPQHPARELTIHPARGKPFLSLLLMIAADLFILGLAAVTAFVIRIGIPSLHTQKIYLQLWPGILIFILFYALVGLYTGVVLHPADELRKIVYSTTLVYITIAAATFLFKGGERYSRSIFLLAWLFTLILIPLGRSLLRSIICRYTWWGRPVIILGAGITGELVAKTLQQNPQFGLRPVVCLDDDPQKWGTLNGIPVAGGLENIPAVVKEVKGAYAILAMPGLPRQRLTELIEQYGHLFSHLLLIPDLFGFSSLWVTAKEVGGILGLELRQELLLPGSRLAKRVIDLVLVALTATPTLIITALAALLIKIDSRGPVFYRQARMGQDRRSFSVIKFRTMYSDSEQRLKRLLETDAGLRAEYEKYHKLRNDPRITRVGMLLRRTSLDELPQVWNVLKGEMSFVGPRAYMPQEQGHMQGKDRTILRVLPGITGMWQVSGRNRLSFSERLDMDVYYVRNWSIWIDLYLLARTAAVVITGEGAF